jgi:type III pantothenate kinase
MRWLLIDAGNTALKWEVFAGATVQQWPGSGRESPAPTRWQGIVPVDSPDLAAEMKRACAAASALTGTPVPTTVFGCGVTSEKRMRAIETALRAANAPAVQWLPSETRFEHDGILVQNSYLAPERLGSDRWHALIGARSRFGRGPLAVINAGTATTVDGLAADGRFLGGVIAPGIDMMRAALAQGTARLPLAGGDYVPHPNNTEDAVHTGVLDAQLGLIERRMRRLRESGMGAVQVLLSGGKAAQLFPLLQSQSGFSKLSLEPDLVLRGLWHHARAMIAETLTRAPE